MHQLLRCGRLGEFLEARIIPERIEHRIEPIKTAQVENVHIRWSLEGSCQRGALATPPCPVATGPGVRETEDQRKR